ncbi:thiosulfate:glutathione sulfurtransferase-like isoform X2 [Petromyzon marinus]|nr:thiosulfate:glutathione sulfurtransferase-like isoform X2 [Petromyzon marinus]XP_032801333.1 thiosulfate:glutathione sulfurtransferase-like isoform X2 [Petromyzon marinus]XP_032801334.1 thiosulfate:glutathione sulfurtransferase-like isoform X2 [Petromyzon marinus]
MTDKVVTYEELVSLLAAGSIRLFDVRSPEEVAKGKISTSAINIPVSELESALSLPVADFSLKYGVPKPEPSDSDVVFHCGVGVRSQRALDTATRLGYTRVRHFPGGYNEWKSKQSK